MRFPSPISLLTAASLAACSKPSAPPTPESAPAPAPAPVLPVPAAYASPDRGRIDDPGIDAYCSNRAAALPARTRQPGKVSEKVIHATFNARTKLLEQTPGAILASASTRTTREDLGDLLYTVGQRHAHDDEAVLALRYWDCAAQQYGDTKSMLKLAMIAFRGAKMFDKPVFGVGEPNYPMAYFWVLSAIYLDMCDGGRDNIVANGLGLMDELQNVKTYVTEHKLDLRTVETDAMGFIKAVDPTCSMTLSGGK